MQSLPDRLSRETMWPLKSLHACRFVCLRGCRIEGVWSQRICRNTQSEHMLLPVPVLTGMCSPQMRTLLFGAWVVFYVSVLLVARRMWTGKYSRSPLARTLFMNALTSSDPNPQGMQEVGWLLKPFTSFSNSYLGWFPKGCHMTSQITTKESRI